MLAVAGSAAAETDLERLNSFLAVPVEERVAAALGREDHRYLAVAGAALEAPGAPPYWIERGRHRIIPGTIEALQADADGALAERALSYARAYNEGLERALGAGEP